MCLTIYDFYTDQTNTLLRLHKEINVFKIVHTKGDFPRSPYRYNIIKRDNEGYFHSDRESKNIQPYEEEQQTIRYGIHVYLHKMDAINHMCDNMSLSLEHMVIKCIGKKEHFVAAGIFNGDPSAVFTKIMIPDKEWNKIKGN